MDKIINPAKYRHTITIRRAATDTTRNDFGERTETGTTLAQVWAAKEDWSGREVLDANRETPMVYTRFVIRWRDDVTPEMTVECDEISYFIESVLDLAGAQKELVLQCRRNAADA